MKAKRKIGMAMKNKKKIGGVLSFRKHLLPVLKTITKTGNGLENPKHVRKSSLIALRAARAVIKKARGRKKIGVPRTKYIPPFERKTVGILPIIPIFARLSALGCLGDGSWAIAKTIIDAKIAKQKLEGDKRHNAAMKEIGQKGSGLYLKKSPKGGYGLFMKKQKNFQCSYTKELYSIAISWNI